MAKKKRPMIPKRFIKKANKLIKKKKYRKHGKKK